MGQTTEAEKPQRQDNRAGAAGEGDALLPQGQRDDGFPTKGHSLLPLGRESSLLDADPARRVPDAALPLVFFSA